MSGKLYLKNHLPVILLNLLGILALSLFLLATGNTIQMVLFILADWLLVLALYLTAGYIYQKKRLEKLLEMARQLKERYLLPEVMPAPDQAEEQVYYQLLKMAGKSMLERISEVERERGEYRAYIEQWVHEVKTPITALKLLCENNRSPFSRDVLVELENINRYTEQALYYARSEHTEKDYSIREMNLADVVHGAIADNKYLLRHCASSRSGRATKCSCPLRTTGSASQRATCRGYSRRDLPARMGGPFTAPQGSACISASACATSWESGWPHPRRTKEPP